MKLTLGPSELKKEFEFSIDWQPHHSRVGVYFSGGIDSLALLMLILAELDSTGRGTTPVLAFTVEKKDGAMDYAARLFDLVRARTSHPVEHINHVPNNEPAYSYGRIGRRPLQKVWADYSEDTIIYAGINQMAPDDVRPFPQKLKVNYPRDFPYFLSPFYDLHKPHVVDLLRQLGHADLIPHTHSCTVQAEGECGQCYSCNERAWGLTALSGQ